MIQEALPERVKLKKKRMSEETYLVAENDDYGFLQEHLRNLYQEPIKVKFDDLRKNWYNKAKEGEINEHG